VKGVLTLRWTTVIVLCVGAGFTLFQGARVTAFAVADMGVDASQEKAPQLAGWRNTLGVAAAARDPGRFVLKMQDPDQFSRREQALADYAAVRPMAAAAWLEVAQLRYTMGQPAARSIEAFSLAQLTAPYEGDVMAGRAMLGPLLWDNLAGDDKRRTVRDLALAPFSQSDYLRVQAQLRAKPKPVRQEIRNGVLAVDSRPEDRLDMLGLNDPDSRAR